MAITTRTSGTVTILELPQRFTSDHGVEELRETVDSLLHDGRRRFLVDIRHHLEGIGDRPRDSRPDVIDGPATLVERLVGIDAMKAARTYKRWAAVSVGAPVNAEA